jgi:hypothetical protein
MEAAVSSNTLVLIYEIAYELSFSTQPSSSVEHLKMKIKSKKELQRNK